MNSMRVRLALLGLLIVSHPAGLVRGTERESQVVIGSTALQEVAANANWADVVFGEGVAPRKKQTD